MRINKINREEYHEQHFLIHKNLEMEFKEIINNYNQFGNKTPNKNLDKTTKSELLRMLIYNFIKEFNSKSNNNFELMEMLSDFRKQGYGTKL